VAVAVVVITLQLTVLLVVVVVVERMAQTLRVAQVIQVHIHQLKDTQVVLETFLVLVQAVAVVVREP
jgi:hypothetical protein